MTLADLIDAELVAEFESAVVDYLMTGITPIEQIEAFRAEILRRMGDRQKSEQKEEL